MSFDLFGIATGALGGVNPMRPALLRVSTGPAIGRDYAASSAYADHAVMIDVQAMATTELTQVRTISQQNDVRAVYARGVLHALDRPLQVGGDRLVFDGSEWLITKILEEWGTDDWCKILVTRQNPARGSDRQNPERALDRQNPAQGCS